MVLLLPFPDDGPSHGRPEPNLKAGERNRPPATVGLGAQDNDRGPVQVGPGRVLPAGQHLEEPDKEGLVQAEQLPRVEL
eukprot:5502587-Pyramimonas_sp.AAC.1